MSRIDAIKAFRENEDIKAANAEVEKKVQIEELIRQVQALKPRIDELISTGNACLEFGIPMTGKAWGGHEGYDTHQFFTNSWSHLVGFVKGPDGIEFLGINAGGAFGKWDFRTDGVKVFSLSGHEVEGPHLGDLEKFLARFDEFESAFYEYVDKTIGKDAPVVPLKYENLAVKEVDAERLKVLLYNAIGCLEEYGCDGVQLEADIGITEEEYDIIMGESNCLDNVIADADAQRSAVRRVNDERKVDVR